jgi:PAS domain S-box-containing protein
LAVLLVVLIGFLAYRSGAAYRRSSEQAAVTRQVVHATNALLSSLKDAETGQRGFLLTGEDRYLEPYRQALIEVPLALDRLARIEAARLRMDQAQRIERLRPLVRDKLDELRQTIDLRRNRGFDAALAIVRTDRGRAIMAQIRSICSEIQATTYNLASRQAEEARSRANQTALIAVVGSIIIFALLAFATVAIHMGTRRREELIASLDESEARARESRDWLEITLASIGDAVITTDKMGNVTFLNRVAESLTGWKTEEATGEPLEQIFVIRNADTGLAAENPVSKTLRKGRIVGLANHTRLIAKDGRPIPIDDSAAPICTVGGEIVGVALIFRDITERKRTEQLREELQRERERSAEARGMERFRLSFEEAPVGMALIRSDGVWLRVNRALSEMTGYTEIELLSQGGTITDVRDRAEESLLFSRILSGDLRAGRMEERYVHKQGHTIYVLLSIASVERDQAGRPVHLVAHVQNLTERKRVEAELEASRAQMVTSSRLSALGMMAGGIAHEINNPLGIIHASAENIVRMAESGCVQVPAMLKNCTRISVTAERISSIVRSLRHIARESSADEFQETLLRQIVDETLELCAERFRAHNIRLGVPAVSPDSVIRCRAAQICQVLLNLLQNAFDELVDWDGDRWVELDVTLHPPWAVFSVLDSGPGIRPENRAHIMEPFFTTKPLGKGTGLGLSISRSIVLEHGGTLELNEESAHTCFVMKLPLSVGSKESSRGKYGIEVRYSSVGR